MKVEPYDFCKPVPFAPELEERLTDWLRDAVALAPKNWAAHLAFAVTMKLEGVEVLRLTDALDRLPEAAVGYRVPIEQTPTPTLLVFPRTLVLALVSGMLDDLCTELPADRALTVVEESLAEFLIGDHFVSAVQETWSGAQPVRLGSLKKEPHPKFTRVFQQDENLVTCSFSIEGPFGKQDCHWLASQKTFLDLLEPVDPGGEAKAAVRPRLETFVQALPVEVSVTLGALEVPFAQLAKLRPGDVVVLNQAVAEPLTATVCDEQKFRVWPGRVGSRQAVQIDSLIE